MKNILRNSNFGFKNRIMRMALLCSEPRKLNRSFGGLRLSLALALTVGWIGAAQAQYVVNFEGATETKSSYTAADISLSGLTWNLNEAVIGDLANDWKNGLRSGRLRGRNGSVMTMTQDKTTGVGSLSFSYRRYGTDTSQQPWAVEYSTNSGVSWVQSGLNITATDIVQVFSSNLNISGNVRIRIRLTTTPGTTGDRRINIDDIILTDFAGSTPSVLTSTNSLGSFLTTAGTASAAQSFTVTGTNLTAAVSVSAPTGFEVSTDNQATFNSSTNISHGSGAISNSVFVRIAAATSVGSYSGNVTVTSTGANTNTVAVSGNVQAAGVAPVITATNFTGQVGSAFSQAIPASGSPTNFTLVAGTLPGGLAFNSNNGTITGTPTNAVTNSITVTADNVTGTSSNATIGFEIAKGTQTITFAALPAKVVGDAPFTLSATANSGLAVSYAISNTNVATVSGNTVTVVGSGTTTITASQVGDDNWNAATDATQTLTVYPSGMVYWNFNSTNPTIAPSDWTIGGLSQGNVNGTVAILAASSVAPAPAYTNNFGIAASLGTNAQTAARIGSINTAPNGSAYFEFTVVAPTNSTNLAITNIFFGYRSTSTGPRAYNIRSSADNYAADLPGGSGVLTNGNTTIGTNWYAVSAPVSVLMTNGATNTFRIYGANGTGAPGANSANWRIDDLTLSIGALSSSQPTILPTPSSISGLTTFNGTPSVASSYVLTASNLTNNLMVTTSGTDLQISSDNASFTNELTLVPNLGSVSNTTLYVRISAIAAQGALAGAFVRHVSTGLTNDMTVAGNVFDATRGASSNSLIGWDAGGETNYGGSPWAPARMASNLIVSNGLTRGSGVLTSGTAAARGWGGVDWSSPDAATAVSSNKFVSFTIAATNGHKLSLSGISKLDYRRSSSGPANGIVQVQIGSGSFSDVAALTFPGTNSTGESLAAAIDLSTNPTLQNIPANTPVTFRIVNFGGTNTTGTWYIFDKDSNPNLDFEVTGVVELGTGNSAPTITSTNAFSGTVGLAFSNDVTATGDAPISFSGTDLPGGLSVASGGAITGTPSAAGTFNATLTATNAAGTNNQSVTFTIAKGTPTITLAPTASAITAGQALSASALSGGTASVAGAFAWTAPSTLPGVGSPSYGVTFTPTDTANYNTATTTVSVTVNPAESTFADWSGGATLDSAGLAKYAIGGASSLTANDGVKPTTALTGGFLVITAIVRTDNSDLTVVGQSVTDLANYASNTSVTVVQGVEVADQNGVPAGHKRKTFSVAQGTDARKFMCLSASLALSGTNTTVSVARDSGGATFLQVTGATAGSTSGGTASSDKRTIYYFAFDTTSSPTYTGGDWPYVLVQGQLSSGAGVTATLTKNSSGMLLVNGRPAYQYVGDSGSTTASGVSGTWPAMRADGISTTTGPSGTIQ